MNSGEKRLRERIFWEIVEEDFGIELTVSEELGLFIYVNSFEESNLTNSPKSDSLHFFMQDYFGLEFYG